MPQGSPTVRWPAYGLLLGLLAAPALPAAGADLPVDLELVLAVDVSGSMDLDEQRLQRAGYLEAITHDEVMNAILSGPLQRIALAYVEWAGPRSQSTVVPWQLIDGPDAAVRFADRLADAPLGRTRYTSISAALQYAAAQFDGNGFAGDRQIIDISGDGPNNSGAPVPPVRDEVADRGIVVNGLPIMIKSSQLPTVTGFDLDTYYEDCVIAGTGAFVVPVLATADFADAIRKKMALEIAGLPPEPTLVAMREPRVDCGIGEKMRGSWYRDP
ncbi:MAG TPA: DUF1194 domain-containing protein [Geminicoccus sp.]|uniref:DUF1194 domain-containing protein n=1 Tax=Geminicoccus sp. TaxID=2024832 RepID=UPI002BA9A388|nr:DUF1194 domain-containing protein [Geminicoccus sp.]HWL67386.1 DUF1194 domain-containing protein [Geminicoccus sp.]